MNNRFISKCNEVAEEDLVMVVVSIDEGIRNAYSLLL